MHQSRSSSSSSGSRNRRGSRRTSRSGTTGASRRSTSKGHRRCRSSIRYRLHPIWARLCRPTVTVQESQAIAMKEVSRAPGQVLNHSQDWQSGCGVLKVRHPLQGYPPRSCKQFGREKYPERYTKLETCEAHLQSLLRGNVRLCMLQTCCDKCC